MVRISNSITPLALVSRYIVTVGILCFSVFVWYMVYYTPLLLQEQESIFLIQNLQRRQQHYYKLQGDVAGLQKGRDKVANTIVSRLSPYQNCSVNQLFKKVLVDTSGSDLLMTHCMPEKLRMKNWYKKQPIKFVAAGSFFDCVNLLEKIKNYKFLNKVPHLVMQQKNDVLMLECVVETYTVE